MGDDFGSIELTEPYGGILVNLCVTEAELPEAKRYANSLPSIQISERTLCDLECMACGAFSPLDRFMGEADYRSVLESMRLADGTLFPVPVTFPVPADFHAVVGSDVAIRDSKNNLLAYMRIEEVFRWDLKQEALCVYGTLDSRHPLVAEMYRWGNRYISGTLHVLQLPVRHDFTELRMTPEATRGKLQELGARLKVREGRVQQDVEHRTAGLNRVLPVVAFQTRNPLHRVHEELIARALREVGGILLLHPVVGMTKSGDVDHYTRVRTYRALSQHFDHERSLLALLPLAMRFAGPREAVWHAIIRRNYGASHLVVGRGHASPFLDSDGKYFHELYLAQEMVRECREELGVESVEFQDMVYLPREDRYEEISNVPKGTEMVSFSSRHFKEEYLDQDRELPEWFSRPEVASILRESHPPRHKQGVCLWFTGLSGSGKSTIAEILATLLGEHGRQVTVLDGDVVRTHLSKGLSFSKEDRDVNIRRIGFVAAEIALHGGTVICAAISPYRATRNDARNMVGSDNFVEIFVDTPLEVCEGRDVKGLYAKARRGEIKGFTGIDDPYEVPEHAEIVLDTVALSPGENARRIVRYLVERGFLLEA